MSGTSHPMTWHTIQQEWTQLHPLPNVPRECNIQQWNHSTCQKVLSASIVSHSCIVYHIFYQWYHIFWYVRELNEAQCKYWSDFMVLHRYVYSSSSLTTLAKYNICTLRGLLALLIVGASFLPTPLGAQVKRWTTLYLHCKDPQHKCPPRFQTFYFVFFCFFRHLTQLAAVSIRIAVHD